MLGVRGREEVRVGMRRRWGMQPWMHCERRRVQLGEQRDEKSGMNATDDEDNSDDREQNMEEMSRKMCLQP